MAMEILASFKEEANSDEVDEHEEYMLGFLSSCIKKHKGMTFLYESDRDNGSGWIHVHAISRFLLSILLRLGCDINMRDVNKRTPLMYCLVSPHVNMEAITFMLDHGADVRAVDYMGISVWDYTVNNNDPSLEVICFFIQRNVPSPAEYSKLPIPIRFLLRHHRTLVALCIPLSLPRCKKDVWVVSDVVRLLKPFLM